MERIRRSLSPSMVVAFIALFAALSGGAFAVSKIGTKNLRNGAVTNTKIRDKAVTAAKLRNGAVTARKLRDGAASTTKLADRAVTSSKLADGAASTTKIGDGAVTAGKLTPGERSEGFVTSQAANIPLPANTPTTVATLNLPAGAFIVTAATSLGGGAAGANFISCELRDDGVMLTGGEGFTEVAAFSDTVTLTGASNGGAITLACSPSLASVARSRAITAIRVGSVNAQ